jgi:hypothetical protein
MIDHTQNLQVSFASNINVYPAINGQFETGMSTMPSGRSVVRDFLYL